jgi:hypothetical protein
LALSSTSLALSLFSSNAGILLFWAPLNT